MQTTFVRQDSTSQTETSSTRRETDIGFRPADASAKRQSAFKSRSPFAAPNGNGNGNGNNQRALVEALVNSKIYQDYERAFTEATGLPVALRPVESWQLPHHGKRNESPFCRLMAEKSRACAPVCKCRKRCPKRPRQEPHTGRLPGGAVRHGRARAVGRPADRLSADRPGVSQEADAKPVRAHREARGGMGRGSGPRNVEASLFRHAGRAEPSSTKRWSSCWRSSPSTSPC